MSDRSRFRIVAESAESGGPAARAQWICSIRSSATRPQWIWCSGTSTWLCTSPVDQAFEHPQQVVGRDAEHRRAQAAHLVERQHGHALRRHLGGEAVHQVDLGADRPDRAGRAGPHLRRGCTRSSRCRRRPAPPRTAPPGARSRARRDVRRAPRQSACAREAHVHRAVALPQDQPRRVDLLAGQPAERLLADPTPPSGRAARPCGSRRCCGPGAGRAGTGSSRFCCQPHSSTAAAFDDVHTVPPCSPTKLFTAAAELM